MDAVAVIPGAHDERLRAFVGDAALARHLAAPRTTDSFTLLALQRTAAAGYVLLSHQRARLGAATLEVLEIVKLVSGSPAVRNALLEAAVHAAAEAGLPWLSLRRPPAQFAEYGLAPCALRSHLTLDPQTTPHPKSGLRLAGEQDIADLAALYAASYDRIPLAPQRAMPDWRWILAGNSRLQILDDNRRRPVAYAALSPSIGALLVREAAAADSGAARMLIQALTAQVRASGDLLALELPAIHVTARAAIQLGARLELRAPAPDAAAWLWGVVDPFAALDELRIELHERLNRSNYHGWEGRIGLEWSGGSAILAVEKRQMSIVRESEPRDLAIRRISLGGLAQFLLGYRDAADLRASDELTCADTDLGLMNAIFPATAGGEMVWRP
ncbi:MAG: hypothetical protein HC822_01905 [Oscillochloris sp.]|nr:hypothetical protein [Oscillochloris sp.]